MIVQTLQNLVTEVSGLWSWIIGIIAGWGLTFTMVVAAIIWAHVRITRLQTKVTKLEQRVITENRDINLDLTKLKK